MPTNKDFKHLVRARSRKTGESYTAARAQLLLKKQSSSPEKRLPPPAATVDYAKLAGTSDAAIKAKTGCTWERWVWALDRVKAHTWPHREIAQYVHEKYKVPDWWTQTVTVGYERIKGLRAIGQRRDGGFEVSKSKTFALPLAKLYQAFSDRRTRERWLPGVNLTVRSVSRPRYMRITWPDQTSVQLVFIAKGTKKSQVAVQHGRLPDSATAGRMKEFWTERLTALGEEITPASSGQRPKA